ncbi:antirestriction protein ArdC [Lachnospiraceae bacterium PM6-15]|uniref:zincin-like metallopeptidase domain-containing protein n=1 Tax=Ohessyouella blattaphilus TaxID=2949333 RepID=UPI003E2549FF
MATAYQKVMESRKEIVEALVKLMDGGFYNNKELWQAQALAPHNPESKSAYHGANRLKLMIETVVKGYGDPRWCTFKQIESAGYKLSKESKGNGVLCEKWIFPEEEYRKLSDERKQKMTEEDKEKFLQKPPKVSFFYLFNASFIVDYPKIEAPKQMTKDELLTLADELKDTSMCPVLEGNGEASAYYSPTTDQIHLPDRNYYKSSEAFLSVLLHEQAHSTGHTSRMNREMLGRKENPTSYAKEELRAELSSLFSCADLGITPSKEGLEDHSDYIKSWLSTLNDNTKELFEVVRDCDKISAYLVENHDRKYPRDKVEEKQTVKEKKKGKGAR